jgi:hypothetical protein
MREQFLDSLSHNSEMVSYMVDNKAERERVSIPSPKHHDLDSYRNIKYLLADENNTSDSTLKCMKKLPRMRMKISFHTNLQSGFHSNLMPMP